MCIFYEWEGAWTGFLGQTAIAITFDRGDDVPLMQKYQTQRNVNLDLTRHKRTEFKLN